MNKREGRLLEDLAYFIFCSSISVADFEQLVDGRKNKKKYMPSLSNQIFVVWQQVISNDINCWFQACEDALHDYDISLQIEIKGNTKSTQRVLDMETKETQTPKTFFKDKTVLKKEVMQSKGT